jgi:hypothetical protein
MQNARATLRFSSLSLAVLAAFGCSNAPADDGDDAGGGGTGGFISSGGTPFVPMGGNGPTGGTGSGGDFVPVGGSGPTGGTYMPTGGNGEGGIFVPTGGTGGDPGPVGGSAERPPALVAAIVLTQTPQVPQASASASITEPGQLPNNPGCTAVRVDPNAPAGAAPRGYDAGAITVSGVNNGNLVFQPSPGANGTVYSLPGAVPTALFNDGANLTAQAAGGPHMGSFSVSVAAPQAVNITAPQQQFGETQNAGDALSVRWNGSGAESLLITVLPADFPDFNPKSGTWVFCGVPDNGSFEIPAGTLAGVAEGADFLGQPALVTITRTKVGLTTVGADQVAITASTTAAVPITLTP